MEIVNLPIEKITPYDQNAKQHPQDQVDYIANSIKTFGFRTPIVVDENFVIIQGHGRRLASLQLDLKIVPCIIADDLSKEKVQMLRLADNKVAESDYEIAILNSELEVMEGFFDVEDFGFFTIEDTELDMDDAPQVATGSDAKICVCPKCGHEWDDAEE